MDPYIGEIRVFAGNYAPVGWALCDGTMLNVSENQALYALLGNTYGGNGSSTFALPDFRLNVAVGTGTISAAGGTGSYPLAAKGGAAQVILNSTTLPSHIHTFQAVNIAANTGSPANALLAQTNGNNSTLTPPYPDVTSYTALPLPDGGTTTTNGTLAANTCQSAGSSQAHDNLMPYVSFNYIIAVNGIYPEPA
ncbi:Microcystin-dependent protein [Chitinophaga sp. CF118]|uniref:phage tail protein n=1 Tax=Chitinophaga sp. CF118 TaxID=1884367 RepID=UPI0008EA0A52|nr:tail fiber protein [Chitinophaga sp. CF118]SFD79574.1 Microcystin-dependent protein [Chitinophaga sp. CF118]